MTIGRLHVITPADPARDPHALVTECLAAGAPVVQIRRQGLSDRTRWSEAVDLVAACHQHGASCIVNDRADLALAAGADGVHVGEDDLPVSAARKLLNDGAVIGGTARDPETARRLVDEGASYLGVGPAYASRTKEGLPPAIGPNGVERVARAVDIPVIAIGGVTADRIPEILDAGAYGVAVVKAVAGAEDVHAATARLLAALDQ